MGEGSWRLGNWEGSEDSEKGFLLGSPMRSSAWRIGGNLCFLGHKVAPRTRYLGSVLSEKLCHFRSLTRLVW